MSAHESERLWDYARGRLSAVDAEVVRAHVEACAACAGELRAAEAGAHAFKGLAVPKRPAAQWKAVDDRVLAAARARLESPSLVERFWDTFRIERWAIGGGIVAAAVLAFLVFGPSAKDEVAPLAPAVVEAPRTLPTTPPAATPAPAPVLPPQEVRIARVVAASSAKRDAKLLAAEETISEGQVVATQRDGDAVLTLPEGSAIDVRADSKITFASLAEDAVKLEVEAGEVVVAASHREARTFEVVAGEVSVTVVGTRFSVMRTVGSAVIRVTEGKVRVAANGRESLVSGGEELTVTRRGAKKRTLSDDLQAELAPFLAKLEKVIQPMPKAPPTGPIRGASRPAVIDRGGADSAAGALPEALDAGAQNSNAVPTDEWALPELSSGDAPAASAPADAGVTAQDAGVATAAKKKSDGGTPWYRDPVESVSRWIDVDWNAPFPPAGMSLAEYRVRQMERLADAGRCKHALLRGNEWVKTFVTDGGAVYLGLHRLEEMTRARCLEKLGKKEEAKRIRAMWQ